MGKDMRQRLGPTRVAIGFTVKSGWTAAVLLTGSAASPRVTDSRRVELSDPSVPDSRQPYHAGFGTARDSGPQLSALIAGVKKFGRRSVTAAIRQYQAAGYPVRGVGIVAGSSIDPERITNDHIRIHALEGRLFRDVVQDAAARIGLSCSVWRDRDLPRLGADVLKRSGRSLRDALTRLGREVDGPWRAEQKAATLAAWIILAGPSSAAEVHGE